MAREPGERFACDGCGKACIGALTKTGNVAPIELDPDPRGNVLLQRQSDGKIHAVTFGIDAAGKVAEAGAELRMNHFSTCAVAQRFRR